MLAAVPLAGNLGIAWLLIEATTAASALLVGFSGRAARARGRLEVPRAHDARAVLRAARDRADRLDRPGWARRPDVGFARFDRRKDRISCRSRSSSCWRGSPRRWVGRPCITGFRTPTPRRRRLSPLCSRRAPAGGARRGLAIRHCAHSRRRRGHGAVEFSSVSGSSRSQSPCRSSGARSPGSACSRIRAWSTWACLRWASRSRTPLPWPGVVVHVSGHAIAKALGFYAAMPLLAHAPAAANRAATGIGRTSPALGASMSLSLGTLAGLPPSPLFASEVLIVAGGFSAGRPWEAAAAALLLALGFLGLSHALVELLAGRARRRAPAAQRRPACCRRADRDRRSAPSSRLPRSRRGCRDQRSLRRCWTVWHDAIASAWTLRWPMAGRSPVSTLSPAEGLFASRSDGR